MSRKPLISHIFTADPSAHVFNGRVFIYPSHDRDADAEENDLGDQYDMVDYHVISQDHPEAPAVDHGVALHLRDVPWASRQLWAPDAACRNGRYYLYFPARDKQGIFRIGVALSDRPEGPFRAEKSPIAGSFSIDPCVFQDDDGEYYLYFGGLWGGQLQCWANGSFDAQAKEPSGATPALLPQVAKLKENMLEFVAPPQGLALVDTDGRPLAASDKQHRFFEGPWMHKKDGVYYFSYSTGDTHSIMYATSDRPTGPFVVRGQVLTPPLGWTTHHSIVEHGGRWWLYYHDASLSGGVGYKRSVKVQELFYRPDGSIITMNP